MVKGLTLFREFFTGYSNQYILIGGTACDILMEDAGFGFRRTKDLDIVLCVEALHSDFIERFWEFIHLGQYQIREGSDGSKKFYRFTKPLKSEYPVMLELFSRKPMPLMNRRLEDITPITIDEEVVSLSAILLDDSYYEFIKNEKKYLSGVPVVSANCMIALKAKAWLDLSERKQRGEKIDSTSINKHKNDVWKLVSLMESRSPNEIPVSVKLDMKHFLAKMEKEQSSGPLGLDGMEKEELLEQIRAVYLGLNVDSEDTVT